MAELVSNKNARVAKARALARQAKVRRAEGAFVIEGPKLVAEAQASEVSIRYTIVGESGLGELDATVAGLENTGIDVLVAADHVIEQIASTRQPQPIVAVADQLPSWHHSVADVVGSSHTTPAFVVVAVDLNDPGNAGTLMRSSLAAGADGLLLVGESVDVTNPKVIRASAGTAFRLPIVSDADTTRTFAALADAGFQVVGADGEAPVSCDEFDFGPPTAIVLGSEAHGLDAATQDLLDAVVTIPMAGGVESLNVSVAGSILAYELARQRRQRPAT